MEKKREEEESLGEATPTEISETAYMGEGPADSREDITEISETAYMGEPEKRTEPKHENEYKREGQKVGKASLPPRENHRPRKSA